MRLRRPLKGCEEGAKRFHSLNSKITFLSLLSHHHPLQQVSLLTAPPSCQVTTLPPPSAQGHSWSLGYQKDLPTSLIVCGSWSWFQCPLMWPCRRFVPPRTCMDASFEVYCARCKDGVLHAAVFFSSWIFKLYLKWVSIRPFLVKCRMQADHLALLVLLFLFHPRNLLQMEIDSHCWGGGAFLPPFLLHWKMGKWQSKVITKTCHLRRFGCSVEDRRLYHKKQSWST